MAHKMTSKRQLLLSVERLESRQTATDKVTVNADAIVGGKTVQKLGFGLHRNHDRLSATRGRR